MLEDKIKRLASLGYRVVFKEHVSAVKEKSLRIELMPDPSLFHGKNKYALIDVLESNTIENALDTLLESA